MILIFPHVVKYLSDIQKFKLDIRRKWSNTNPKGLEWGGIRLNLSDP